MSIGSAGAAAVVVVLLAGGGWSARDRIFPRPATELLTPADGEDLNALEASHPFVSWTTLMSIGDAGSRSFVLPPDLARLNGRTVSLDGYLLPIEMSGDHVTAFFLNAAADRCGFGAPANAQDRVEVTVSAGRALEFTHRSMRVFGVLTVKPVFERGALVALYSLVLDAMGPPGLGF